MENLNNNEKIKDSLIQELDQIIDEKRGLFEQIKQVEVNYCFNVKIRKKKIF